MGQRENEFERIALPHAPALLRFALRLARSRPLAEDLVQEALLQAWRGYRQFEPGSNARAWLFRILVNAFYSQSRKARSAPALQLLTPDMGTAGPNFDSLEVTQALDRLPADQRSALLLAVVEGFTCREIAEIMTIPIGTVMSRLARAREAMREALAPAKAVR
jgi:RNA polymerase sigma-70 factor (ECF subfamily)